MSFSDTIRWYNEHAQQLATAYESLAFEDVHSGFLDLLPAGTAATVLDIGAGSGRDAAWFAEGRCDVVAVEPSAAMRTLARELHPQSNIAWLDDRLPGLEKTLKLGLTFDIIFVSAVWMHIPPPERQRAFRKILSLLAPAGILIITLRQGPIEDGREAFPVSTDEIQRLAWQHGVAIKRITSASDFLNRGDVTWQAVCLQLPDDGTEALPLLRHTILRDTKSSTYKLALLRVLVKIADTAGGIVGEAGGDNVSVPLGLVALYWVRMYKPLLEAGIPQAPANKDQRGLGFVKEAFHQLGTWSPYDLRIGATFAGSDATTLRQALTDARNTIHKMPANYITYPNSSEHVFKTKLGGGLPRRDGVLSLDAPTLFAFGELLVPRHIWTSMSRLASWIEPALVSEWVRLMQSYSAGHGREYSYDDLMRALVWLDPQRDTAFVRSLVNNLWEKSQSIYCVWSGSRLDPQSLDIDHCFPFSAWPCGDLWNLMPTQRRVNQHQKADKLITAHGLRQAQERLLEWWQQAYVNNEAHVLSRRFENEAAASLPLDGGPAISMEEVFDGILLKRNALKRNLQLEDWEPNFPM